MSSQSGFLQIIDVYKAYSGKVILDNIDFQVSRGEFCTVVGPSGCGKSTLLRLIVGAEIPTAGRVLLEQQSVGPPDIHRGIVFQKYSLFPHLTVLDNVSLGLGSVDDRDQRRCRAKKFKRRQRLCWRKSGWPSMETNIPMSCQGGCSSGSLSGSP